MFFQNGLAYFRRAKKLVSYLYFYKPWSNLTRRHVNDVINILSLGNYDGGDLLERLGHRLFHISHGGHLRLDFAPL